MLATTNVFLDSDKWNNYEKVSGRHDGFNGLGRY